MGELINTGSNPKVELGADHGDESFVSAFNIIHSCTLPSVLSTAIELNLFTIMAKANGGQQLLSAREIAAQLPVANNQDAPVMLDRLLRMLATHSLVSCSIGPANDEDDNNSNLTERTYGLTPVSKWFVPDENGISLGPYLAVVEGHVQRASWRKLKNAILEGGTPFNMVHGGNAFEYYDLDPTYNDIFNRAMLNITSIIVKELLLKYKGFEDIKQIVDVGGGLGHTLHAITSKYPSIRGINFDLAHVIQEATPYPGVEHIAGDMFEGLPKGDIIFMKWILHDWSDNHCLKLLKNCYHAIPSNGNVIIVDSIVTEKPQTTALERAVTKFDVHMMAQCPGGKERTKKEFLKLALDAGFKGINLICLVGFQWVMEFYK